MKKRMFAWLLALALAAGLLPAGALAAENQLYWRGGQIADNVLTPEGNYSTSLSGQAGNSSVVALYTDNTSGTPMAADAALTYTPGTGGAAGDVTVGYDDTLRGWIIQYHAVCSGTLSAVTGGTTYSLDVSAVLPDVGLYSANAASAENFISSFTVTGSSRTFYLCANTGWTLTGVTQNSGSFATVSLDSGGKFAAITVSDSYNGEQDLSLAVSAGGPNGQSWSGRYFDIALTDARPKPAGLYFAEPDWGGSGPEIPASPAYQNTALPLTLGYSRVIALYYYDGTGYAPVTSGASAAGPFTLTPNAAAAGLYDISAAGSGSGSISYTVSEHTYTVPLTSVLPGIGYFSSQSRSDNKLVTDYTFSGSGSNVLWLMSKDGFDETTADKITWSTLDGSALPAGYMTAEKTARGATGRYDVKVTLLNYFGANVGLRAKVPQDEGVYNADVAVTIPYGFAGTVTADNSDYRVGLGNYDESSVNDSCYIDTGMGVFGPGGDVRNDETAVWKTFTFMQVLAASEVAEGGNMTSFHLNRTLTGQITVNRVWIEPLTGDRDAMALSPTGAQELTGNIPAAITVYAKPGRCGYARVWANVTVGGGTFDVSSLGCFEKVEIKTYTRPEGDTVTALNAFLAGDLVSDINAAPQEGQRTYFRIDLNGNHYDGTIDFPDSWPQFSNGVSVEIIGSGAAVTGGMDLTKVNLAALDGVSFTAKTTHQGNALYHGGVNTIIGCSFTGYDIACDSSSADAALCVYSNCTFTDNNTGIVFDHGRVQANMGTGVSTGNSFLRNGTAIQIKSTNAILTPFELRFSNSNFIGNTTDVDVDCNNSSFYFYADYFGSGTSASSCQYCPPTIDCADGSFVYTNPRRSAPYSSGETSVPPLVLDARLPVSILNSQAASLPIYGGSLADEEINVLDDGEQTVGTWSFK